MVLLHQMTGSHTFFMDLLVVGISHRTAPISLRERVAITPERMGQALGALQAAHGLGEVAILSTCNRTEIYALGLDDSRPSPERISTWLAEFNELPVNQLQEAIYVHQGDASLRHLIRVASGLDSMVLGEPQIFGQVKESFETARLYESSGNRLDQIAQNTYRVAKRVRSSTAIGQTPVSIASIAVDLATQLFSKLADCSVLLIGAGETIELVATHLKQGGVERITIANRTLDNARRLATELGGEAIALSDIGDHISHTDILIASTASQLPILGKGTVERALKSRRHKPIFMVDLAVPRDIEPEIADLPDVYLYSVDDLEQIIADNISNREEAAAAAEIVIAEAMEQLEAEEKSRAAVDVLVRFRNQNEAIKNQELDKALERLGRGEDPAAVLQSLANQLTNKIIHHPSVQLKQASADGRKSVVDALVELFQLDADESDKGK